MPSEFGSPLDAGSSTNSSYFGIVSSGKYRTIVNPYSRTRFHDCTDGTSYCIAVVEARREIPWTKPEDIRYDESRAVPEFGGWFPQGFHAAMADGRVRFLDKDLPETTLRSLITINDGVPVSKQDLHNRRFQIRKHSGDRKSAEVIATEDDVVEITIDDDASGFQMSLRLSEEAAIRLQNTTGQMLSKTKGGEPGRLDICFDGKVLASPKIMSVVTSHVRIVGLEDLLKAREILGFIRYQILIREPPVKTQTEKGQSFLNDRLLPDGGNAVNQRALPNQTLPNPSITESEASLDGNTLGSLEPEESLELEIKNGLPVLHLSPQVLRWQE